MRKKISSVSGWQQSGRRQSKEEDGSGLVIHTHNEGGVDRIPHNTHAKQAQNSALLARRADKPRTNTRPRVRHRGLKRGSKQGLNRVDELRGATTSGGFGVFACRGALASRARGGVLT